MMGWTKEDWNWAISGFFEGAILTIVSMILYKVW